MSHKLTSQGLGLLLNVIAVMAIAALQSCSMDVPLVHVSVRSKSESLGVQNAMYNRESNCPYSARLVLLHNIVRASTV